ncbi:flagellar hook-basal body complex protein [Roseinatronobacter alkalisoli]|uniref:Flagellar basal-body rod protein FlgF n=1 Tax=Roseinatronobacter alkalisoli TaxID=3028235 RepID=A0ABT5T4W1_9RHOB|nr:flagellar hook-basal body complex protein [Roseinatronobacter sp. HJB301]MDD7970155.1 flagellar hook-basal body complex protein [Roseinatronobacter sp. HJB301]
MDNAAYVALTRLSGLKREMQVIAHNIANASTTGYRREGAIFSEFVVGGRGQDTSLSMALGNTRQTFQTQGELTQTNGNFDLAIEGDGFFQLETPQGLRLTRAGMFTPNAAGELVNMDGHLLLDAGGAPIFVPPDARSVAMSGDGTFSADGQPFAQVGLVRPADPVTMTRAAGTLFAVDGELEPVLDARLRQGFLEGSNVDPMPELARMIAVQRAYEQGQRLLEREDDRIKTVIQTLGR